MTFPGFYSDNSTHPLDKQQMNTQPLDCDDISQKPATERCVFALGTITYTSPDVDVEKEWWQTAPYNGPGRAVPISDFREHQYITRQMCWVLEIDDIYTYILEPRNEVVFQSLLNTFEAMSQTRIEKPTLDLEMVLVVGTLGDTAKPCRCNGLELPILHLDHIEFLYTTYTYGATVAHDKALRERNRVMNQLSKIQSLHTDYQEQLETLKRDLRNARGRLRTAQNSQDSDRIEQAQAEVNDLINQRDDLQARLDSLLPQMADLENVLQHVQGVLDEAQNGMGVGDDVWVELFKQYRRKNTGQSDENRALNYVLTREFGVYDLIQNPEHIAEDMQETLESENVAGDSEEQTNTAEDNHPPEPRYILIDIDVQKTDFESDRRFYDVIFSFRDCKDGLTDKYFIRVDVTGKWPFRVGGQVGMLPQSYRGHKFE